MCFSQTTSTITQDSVVISSEQLKTANLIFAEHQYLLLENELLATQVSAYKDIEQSYIQQDSIRLRENQLCTDALEKTNKQLTSAQRKATIFKWTTVGCGVAGLLAGTLIGVLITNK